MQNVRCLLVCGVLALMGLPARAVDMGFFVRFTFGRYLNGPVVEMQLSSGSPERLSPGTTDGEPEFRGVIRFDALGRPYRCDAYHEGELTSFRELSYGLDGPVKAVGWCILDDRTQVLEFQYDTAGQLFLASCSSAGQVFYSLYQFSEGVCVEAALLGEGGVRESYRYDERGNPRLVVHRDPDGRPQFRLEYTLDPAGKPIRIDTYYFAADGTESQPPQSEYLQYVAYDEWGNWTECRHSISPGGHAFWVDRRELVYRE